MGRNTVRSISAKTKSEVIGRDRICVICRNAPIQNIHHAYYGIDAEYGHTRNDKDRLVGLCSKCHDMLHFRGGNDYREICKEYLKKV